MATEEEKKKLLQPFDEKMSEIANLIFNKSQDNLITIVPYGDSKRPQGRKPSIISNTGDLLRSGSVDISKFLEKKIEYDAPHAMPIEFGSDPHSVPIDVLIKWAKRKLGVNDKTARAIAFSTHKLIKVFGTDAHPYLRPAIDDTVKRRKI